MPDTSSLHLQPVHYQNLGLIPYAEAWELQESLLRVNTGLKQSAERGLSPLKIPTQHYLLFCEHPHVYTLGKSGHESHLLIDEATRAAEGIEYFKINRGGDITYHGPGQITGYPIFDLEKLKPDLVWYLRTMEEVMIALLADYGLVGGRVEGATGVWLGIGGASERKICAFGVKCSRWVTMHGFALNVNSDLRFFDHIVPCGIPDKGVTSLEKELGYRLDMAEVEGHLKGHFASQFGLEYIA